MHSVVYLVSLLQLIVSCYTQVLPNEEQKKEKELIDYVIKLYYYPDIPKIDRKSSPSEVDGFIKRTYLYEFLTCMYDDDFLGFINANILSHTICVSLCHSKKEECSGGVYLASRKKCYLLKNTVCATDEEKANHKNPPPIGWDVIFFYADSICRKLKDGEQCNSTTTTTAAPTTAKPEQSTAAVETNEEVQQERVVTVDANFVHQPIPNTFYMSLAMSESNQANRFVRNMEQFAAQRTLTLTRRTFNAEPIVNPHSEDFIRNWADEALPMRDFTEELFKKKITDGRVPKDPTKSDTTEPKSPNSNKPNDPLKNNAGVKLPKNEHAPENPKMDSISPNLRNKDLLLKNLKRLETMENDIKRSATCVTTVRKKRAGSSCLDKLQKVRDSFRMMKHKSDISNKIPTDLLQRLKLRITTKSLKISSLKNLNWKQHAIRVAKAGKIVAFGLFAADMVNSVLKGDLYAVAMNVLYFALGYGSPIIGQKLTQYGTKLISKGFFEIGILTKMLGRLVSGIGVILALHDFIDCFRKFNASDEDRILDLIESGILLALSVAATSGNPIVSGIAIGLTVVVMISFRIYKISKAIAQIEKTLKLSAWERLQQGWLLMWGRKGLEHITRLHNEKFVNEQLRDMCIDTLQHSPEFKYCFQSNVQFANNQTTMNEHQIIDLTSRRRVKPTRASPRHFCDYRTFCLPTDIDPKQSLTERSDFECKNAFGVNDMNKTRGYGAHFELGDGDDEIRAANMNNRYILGNGTKTITGNRQQDVFYLTGIHATGTLDGNEGYDVLVTEHFKVISSLNVTFSSNNDFSISYISSNEYGKRFLLQTRNIEDLQGRHNQTEFINVPCHLKHFNGNGGNNTVGGEDVINLMEECMYDLELRLKGQTIVNNHAIDGKFVYRIPKSSGRTTVYLRYNTTDQANTFFFDYKIEEVVDLIKEDKNMTKIILINQDHTSSSKESYYEILIQNPALNAALVFNDYAMIHLTENNGYMMTKSNLSLMQIFDAYQHTAEKLGLVLSGESIPSNEVIMVGHGQKGYAMKEESLNVLSNDPFKKTIIIPGKTKNVFLIGANEELYNGSITNFLFPEVIIDFKNRVPVATDEIDLTVIAKKASKHFDVRLYLDASIIPKTKDIVIDVHFENSEEKLQWIGNIVLKNAIVNSTYTKVVITLYSGLRIEILDNNHSDKAKITKSNMTVSLIPMPMNFDAKEYDVIALSEDDLHFDTHININTRLYDYDYYIYNTSLIISNIAKPCPIDVNATTILLAKFLEKPVMRSINLNFTDLYIPMRIVAAFHDVHLLPDAAKLFGELE